MTSSMAEQRCRRFSLAEIQSATGDFSDAHVIGKGGFGKVYKGTIDNGSLTVALKRLASNSNQGETEFAAEMETLTKVRHRNLVAFIGYCDDEGEMILVYEYMANGTLADHLYHLSNGVYPSSLTWNDRLKICIGAGRGLDYLHSGCSIIHRDVKSTNILLDENFTAKVSDFGLAKHLSVSNWESHVSASLKGTFGYIDPSYFATGRLTRASDTYAFGVVLLEVLTGKPALDRRMADEGKLCMNVWAQEKIRNGKANQIVASDLKGEISEGCLKSFVGVVKRCLYYEPQKRLTMTQAVAQLEFALEMQETRGARAHRLQFGPFSAFWNRVKPYGSKSDENEVGVDELPQANPAVEEEDGLEYKQTVEDLKEHNVNMLPTEYGTEHRRTVDESEKEQNVKMLPVEEGGGIEYTRTVDELEDEDVYKWGLSFIRDEIEKKQNVKMLPVEEGGIEYTQTVDELEDEDVYKWGLSLFGNEIEKKQNVKMLPVEEEGGIENTQTVDELANEHNADVLPVEEKEDGLEFKQTVDELEKEHNVNMLPVEEDMDTWSEDELEEEQNVEMQPVEEEDGIDYTQTVDELENEHNGNMLPIEIEEDGLKYKPTLDEFENEHNANTLPFEEEEEEEEEEYEETVDEFEKEHNDNMPPIEEDALEYTEAVDTSDELESEYDVNMLPIAILASDMFAVTDEFSRKCWIADGSNGGSIFIGVLKTGKDAAIKRLYKKLPDQEFLAQVSTISSLKHKNVVELHGYCADGGLQVLVYEYAPRRSLHDILHGLKGDCGLTLEPGPGLSWPQRIEIAIGAAKGLSYIHEKGLIHRNIKSSNVLVFDDIAAKITDLHLSTWCSCRKSYLDECHPPCFAYHPPEFSSLDHSQKGDIYSFGVVLLELLTGRKTIRKHSFVEEEGLVEWATPMLSEDMVENIVDARLRGAYPRKAVVEVASVAGYCLAEKPDHRPSMIVVLRGLLIASLCTQHLMKQESSRSRSASTTRVEDRAPAPGSRNTDEPGVLPPSPGSPNADESCIDGRIMHGCSCSAASCLRRVANSRPDMSIVVRKLRHAQCFMGRKWHEDLQHVKGSPITSSSIDKLISTIDPIFRSPRKLPVSLVPSSPIHFG